MYVTYLLLMDFINKSIFHLYLLTCTIQWAAHLTPGARVSVSVSVAVSPSQNGPLSVVVFSYESIPLEFVTHANDNTRSSILITSAALPWVSAISYNRSNVRARVMMLPAWVCMSIQLQFPSLH